MSRFPRTRHNCHDGARLSCEFQIDFWKFSSFLVHFVIFILALDVSRSRDIPFKKKKGERIFKRFRKFGEENLFRDKFIIEA